jgi:hypothetical protein
MEKAKVINGGPHHNAGITARTAILLPTTGQQNDGLVIQMGRTGPHFLAPMPGFVEWGLEPFESVREFTAAFMRVGSPEHTEMEASTTRKDRETYKALLQLRSTHATFPIRLDEKAARRELSSAGSKLIEDPRIQATFGGGEIRRIAAWFYPAFFNRELARTRLVLWLTKQNQFVPAILCPDMKTAMFAFAAFGHIAACPNCGNLFALDSGRVDGSKGERYCKAVCGERYRQKVYRLKVKAKTGKSKKKRSKVVER